MEIKPETKKHITLTAFKLFVKHGFTDVSVNDIVVSANVTKGGFYHHFKSKDKLIEAVFSHCICPYFENAIKEAESLMPPKKRAEGFVDRLAGYEQYVRELFYPESIDTTQFYFLVMEGIKKYEYISAYYSVFYNKAKKLIREALCEGIALGQLLPGIDVEAAAMRILTAHEGMVLVSVYSGSFPDKRDLLYSFYTIWDSLAVPSNGVKGGVTA